ncbi:YqhR family membrane protein [Paenibacillus sp. GYB003]|uniref:YqhR family membrane protein n=1 Tax=Paenibacillus sp. GYB003 TaxID=2994392 RepID=UPI002F96DA12
MEAREISPDRTGVWSFALQIGIFAGLIWGAVKAAAFYFKFTKVPASFMAKPFFAPSYMNTTAAFWMGWLCFILFSVIASLLYGALFRSVKGHWPGLIYGAAWWSLVTLLIGPSTGMMRWIYRYDWNTIVTDLCLFLVWGLFIGFSISFEFTDERHREPAESH